MINQHYINENLIQPDLTNDIGDVEKDCNPEMCVNRRTFLLIYLDIVYILPMILYDIILTIDRYFINYRYDITYVHLFTRCD